VHKGDKGKKVSSDTAYQDSVTVPLSRAHDEDIAALQEEDEDNEDDMPIHPSTSSDQLKEVLTAVEKVNFVLPVRNMTNCYTLAS
jgi:hypothetical protein